MLGRIRQAMWILAGVALLTPAAFSCSKKESRYPEDHARVVRVDDAVEALRKAYVEKDRQALGSLLPSVEPLEQLSQDIQNDFKTFDTIELELTIDRIIIDGDEIDVYLHWQGFWKRAPEDVGIRERGHGILRWTGTQSILLKEIQGDLPFGMAGRHRGGPSLGSSCRSDSCGIVSV